MKSHKLFVKKFDEITGKYSRKCAMTYMLENGTEKKLTFSQVRKFVHISTLIFVKYNLRQGDRVALVMPACPWTVMTAMSLMYSGITVVPIDPALPYDEIEHIILFSDVRAVFTNEENYRKMSGKITENIPCFKQGRKAPAVPFCKKTFSLPPTPDPEYDVAAIIFSSGTTGQMKGIKQTYISVLKAKKVSQRVAGLKDNMKYLLVLPFNHIAGFTSALTFFLIGCETGFIENVDASKLQKGLVQFEPHCFVIVPKVYEVMIQKIYTAVHEKGKTAECLIDILLKMSGFFRKNFGINIGKVLFRGLRKQVFGGNITGLGTGASPCKAETAEFFLNLGVTWDNFYATTETNVPITATGVLDRYPSDTVGNVRHHPEINVRINNADSNGIGEITVKSELIMKGYFREPELTKSAFINGYFRTGDYGYIDNDSYLHITGRIKESIVLQNGKKVSPSDVDEYYNSQVQGYEIASRGILDEKELCDEIHLFIEDNKSFDRNKVMKLFEKASRNAPSMYRLSGIHFIDSIPKTSVGKVKRFCLNPDPSADYTDSAHNEPADSENIHESVCRCIHNLMCLDDDFEITGSMRLREDIGMDSLSIFEMCVQLDEIYNISLESELHENITVDDIVSFADSGSVSAVISDAEKYPLERTENDYRNFRIFTKISRCIWNMQIKGLENIGNDDNYIFCPNHESHFDGMWIIGCLNENISHNICSIAADYLFEDKVFNKGIRIMGGIPVHRTGNTTTAMTRVYDCITKEKYSLLIHPEGTRTRNGKLGQFKKGAAELSVKSGIKIIPVCISGAREIFPPENNFPHLFDFRHFRKYGLTIQFGKPVSPDGLTAEELTGLVRQQITDMKSLAGKK